MNMPGTIIFDSALPWWVLVPCGALFAWLTWKTYGMCKLTTREKCVLWGLRMGAFLLLAWFVMQPSLRKTGSVTELPAVALVVDVSASMEDNPLGAPETRAQRAVEYLESDAVKRLEGRARVVRFAMGGELTESPATWAFTAPASRIASSLAKVGARFRGDRLAGVVLLSDGLDQSPEAFDAGLLGAPVFVPELEVPGQPRDAGKADFGIGELSYPKRVVVNWKAQIDVPVRRLAGTGAAAFPVKLTEGGRLLQTENVDFQEREMMQRVSFTVKPEQIGTALYRVHIEPEADEDQGNNQRELLIEVTDARQRVLYLEGTPRWDFKFLKRGILAEKNLQLSAFLRTADGAFINFDESGDVGSLPKIDAETLRNYRAVILGDLKSSMLRREDAACIRQFVEKGGGLLFIGGANSYGREGIITLQELASVLPASSMPGASMREGRFLTDFTPEGRALPSFASLAEEVRLPPVLSIWGPVKAGEFSTCYLAASDGSPLLLARRCGQGRSAMLLSDSFWRWQMGARTGEGGEGGEGGKGLYGRFITQLLHWLCPENAGEGASESLQLLLASYEVDQNQRVVVGAAGAGSAPGAGVTCAITAPSGKSMSLPMPAATLESEVGLSHAMNGFRCEFTPSETGSYSLTLTTLDGSRTATALLLSRFPEHEHTGAPIDRDFLRGIATKSGGTWCSWNQRKSLLDKLKLTPATVETVTEKPIWNKWPLLAVLLVLFCLEWWLRRRWDLV